MTTPDAALAPLRDALLARAENYARTVRQAAESDATAALEQTREEGARIVATAREEGVADSQGVLVSQRARVRGQVRALVLQAHKAVYDELRTAVRDDARSLVADCPELTARLEALGRDRIGPQAQVLHGPGGSVVAELGDRRWQWTPDTLADDAVRELGADLERLWTP